MRISWTKLVVAACIVPAAVIANGCFAGPTPPDNESATEDATPGSEDGPVGEAKSAATWCCRVPTPALMLTKPDCYTWKTWGIWAAAKCAGMSVVGAGTASMSKGACDPSQCGWTNR